MSKIQSAKSVPLDLEVKEVERRRRPGCNSSSTSPMCTCPIYLPDTKK
jgi:hypothetical protein